MAEILILQEEPCEETLIHSLKEFHNVEVASSSDAVIKQLHQRRYDLVISRVHLKFNSLFDLLRLLQRDPVTAGVPVICFCGIGTRMANVANEAVKAAAVALGASEFISIEQFCINERCDFERLRAAIEHVISDGKSNEKNASDSLLRTHGSAWLLG